jgi:hypothetical protein
MTIARLQDGTMINLELVEFLEITKTKSRDKKYILAFNSGDSREITKEDFEKFENLFLTHDLRDGYEK